MRLASVWGPKWAKIREIGIKVYSLQMRDDYKMIRMKSGQRTSHTTKLKTGTHLLHLSPMY
jgi:hypothetical protein